MLSKVLTRVKCVIDLWVRLDPRNEPLAHLNMIVLVIPDFQRQCTKEAVTLTLVFCDVEPSFFHSDYELFPCKVIFLLNNLLTVFISSLQSS